MQEASAGARFRYATYVATFAWSAQSRQFTACASSALEVCSDSSRASCGVSPMLFPDATRSTTCAFRTPHCSALRETPHALHDLHQSSLPACTISEGSCVGLLHGCSCEGEVCRLFHACVDPGGSRVRAVVLGLRLQEENLGICRRTARQRAADVPAVLLRARPRHSLAPTGAPHRPDCGTTLQG